MSCTMRAYAYYAFGPAEEVLKPETRAVPVPERGEVLVKIHASGLNPHDTKRRSGWLGGEVPLGGIIPHADGGGDVVGVGNGVLDRHVGQRVLVFGAGHGVYDGTAAQYCRVPAEHTIPIPDVCTYEQAAALGVPAVTACYAVLSGGPLESRTVLVHGGLGAVGRAAVEVAHFAGARVIATLSDRSRKAELFELGATHVLCRKDEDIGGWVEELTGGRGVDLIVDVDFGANVDIDARCIAENGRVACYSSTSNKTPILPYYDFAMKGVRLHFVQAMNIPAAKAARASAVISTLLVRGGLRAPVAHRLSLKEIATGHSLLEKGEVGGKIIYIVD